MDYVAAIPMNANALFGTPPTPGSLLQAANVDNNTGLTTQETLTEQAFQNYALLTGDYTGDGAEYTTTTTRRVRRRRVDPQERRQLDHRPRQH